MKKIFIVSFIALGVLFGCNDDDRLANDDITGNKIVGFGEVSKSVSYFEDEGQVAVDLQVVLVGLGNGQTSSQPIEISYVVNTGETTAVQGEEYSFADTSGKITIPAGSTFASIPLLVNTGSLNPTVATQLVLTLSSSTPGVVVGKQFEEVVVSFVGCISTISPGNYSATVEAGSAGTVGRVFPETISLSGVNTFKTLNTWPYYPGPSYTTAVSTYGFSFEDVCGDITVSEQNLFNYFTNLVSGTGHVIDANSFVINYKVVGASTALANITYRKIN